MRRWMKGHIDRTLLQVAAVGYTMVFRQFCDAYEGEMRGEFRCVVDHQKRLAVIARHPDVSLEEMVEAVDHAAEHVRDTTFDCGGRSFGRGEAAGRCLVIEKTPG